MAIERRHRASLAAFAVVCLGVASPARGQEAPAAKGTTADVASGASAPVGVPTSAPAPASASTPTSAPASASAPADVEAETVTVRGLAADNLERATGSTTRVSETQIRRQQPQSTSEVFRRIPGLNVRSEDGMGLRLNLGVRGLSPSRSRLVLLQEDGVPVVVSPYGEPELYYSTPIERIERLDVLKGPDVLLYGPQTVGGVVNLYTWSAPTRETWSVEADYGQRSYAKGLVRYGNAVGDVRYLVQAFHKQGDGFRNMPFDVTDVMAKVVFPTGRGGEATLKLTAYDETSHTTYVGLTQGMYDARPRQDSVAPDDLFGIRRYEASLRHEQRLGEKTTLRTTLFAFTLAQQIYQQDFDRGLILPSGDYARILGPNGLVSPMDAERIDRELSGRLLAFRNTRSLRDRQYDVAGIEPQLEHKFAWGPVAHRLVVGGRFMVDHARRKLSQGTNALAETGDLRTDDTTSILGMAAYVQDRMAFRDDLIVTPAVRVEHSYSRRFSHRIEDETGVHDVDLRGSSSATGVMPGVAFAYGKPRYNLFWGVHSGYSPPRISQAITPTGGDTGLSAERSMNYELGTHLRPLRWLRGELTGFVIHFDNQLISNNTLSGSSSEFKNGGKTRHYGVETMLVTHLGKREKLPLEIDLSAQYTFVHATFTDGPNAGKFVPYAPEHTFTATVDGQHDSGVGGQISWSYVGYQFADETNSVEPDVSGRAGLVPAFNVLDLGLRYRHAKTGISVLLNVKNALDDVYLSSRLPNGIFTSGFRQAWLGLKWSGS